MSDELKKTMTEAFINPQCPDIFYSNIGLSEIWKEDPFDIEEINSDTRQVFEDMLNNAVNNQISGRVFTILGASGAGKTHMMRYFRTRTHQTDRGYFAYLQLATPCDSYDQYILSKLIDFLTYPYHMDTELNSLMHLSNSLIESPGLAKKRIQKGGHQHDILTALREWDLSPKHLAKIINQSVQAIQSIPAYESINPNILSALMYLQVQDHYIKSLILNYLHTQALSPIQKESVQALADINFTPFEMIIEIGKIMWAVQKRPLVLCVDQLEGMLYFTNHKQRINQALGTLVDLAAHIPSSIIVIACLDSVFKEIENNLTTPIRSKISIPPSPKELKTEIENIEQLHALVGKRLSFLYDFFEIETKDMPSTDPFPTNDLNQLTGMRARKILDICGAFHQKAIQDKKIPEQLIQKERIDPPIDESLENMWQTFLNQWTQAVSIDSAELANCLSIALSYCSDEFSDMPLWTTNTDDKYVYVMGESLNLMIGICNKKPQNNSLLKELQSFAEKTGTKKMIIVRSVEFPKTKKSQIAQYIGHLISKGARRILIEHPDWRAIMAFPEFLKRHRQKNGLSQWRKQMHPLARLSSIQNILGLEDIGGIIQIKKETIEEINDTGSNKNDTNKEDENEGIISPPPILEILLGKTEGLKNRNIELDIAELTRHAAFLGGSGSGKSTLALNIIEQILLNDIPVVLIDRKGDLASYANPEAFNNQYQEPEMNQKCLRLKQHLDIQLFTPGHPLGRPLSVSIVPEGTYLLSEYEREQISSFSAAALAEVMGFRSNLRDQACRAILKQAIFVLTEINDPEEVLLDEIIELVNTQDPELLNRVGALDNKNFQHLHQALLILKTTRGHLFKADGEQLNADLLFGLGHFKRQGKTRLSIINTKFIGDHLDQEFYVANLLMELRRWISKRPSENLQAVIMFDEADMYLPATRKPATKGPMEDLLKRARSGGLGIFLATQSPGDFDYKSKENIRTWFLGRIKETTALAKLKPILAQTSKGSEELGAFKTGQFLLICEKQSALFKGLLNTIPLKQIPEEEILKLSRQ